MTYSAEDIRKSMSKTLSAFSMDIARLPTSNETKMQIFKMALRLIKLFLADMGIDDEEMMKTIREKRASQ